MRSLWLFLSTAAFLIVVPNPIYANNTNTEGTISVPAENQTLLDFQVDTKTSVASRAVVTDRTYFMDNVAIKLPPEMRTDFYSVSIELYPEDGKVIHFDEHSFQNPNNSEEEFKEIYNHWVQFAQGTPPEETYDESESLEDLFGRRAYFIYRLSIDTKESRHRFQVVFELLIRLPEGYLMFTHRTKSDYQDGSLEIGMSNFKEQQKAKFIDYIQNFMKSYTWTGNQQAVLRDRHDYKTTFGFIKVDEGQKKPGSHLFLFPIAAPILIGPTLTPESMYFPPPSFAPTDIFLGSEFIGLNPWRSIFVDLYQQRLNDSGLPELNVRIVADRIGLEMIYKRTATSRFQMHWVEFLNPAIPNQAPLIITSSGYDLDQDHMDFLDSWNSLLDGAYRIK